MFPGMLRRPSPTTFRAVAAAGLTVGGADFFRSCCATGSGCFVSGSFCNAFGCFVPLSGRSVPFLAGSGSLIAGFNPLHPFRIIRIANPCKNSPRDTASN